MKGPISTFTLRRFFELAMQYDTGYRQEQSVEMARQTLAQLLVVAERLPLPEKRFVQKVVKRAQQTLGKSASIKTGQCETTVKIFDDAKLPNYTACLVKGFRHLLGKSTNQVCFEHVAVEQVMHCDQEVCGLNMPNFEATGAMADAHLYLSKEINLVGENRILGYSVPSQGAIYSNDSMTIATFVHEWLHLFDLADEYPLDSKKSHMHYCSSNQTTAPNLWVVPKSYRATDMELRQQTPWPLASGVSVHNNAIIGTPKAENQALGIFKALTCDRADDVKSYRPIAQSNIMGAYSFYIPAYYIAAMNEKLVEPSYFLGKTSMSFAHAYEVLASTRPNMEQQAILENSFRLYQQVADSGSADGQYELALAYKNGFGTEVNTELALY